jgi:hypothetical protein
VKTAAGDDNCLYTRFHPLLEAVQNIVRVHVFVVFCWQLMKKAILSISDEVSIF